MLDLLLHLHFTFANAPSWCISLPALMSWTCWYVRTQTIQERGAIGFCSPGTAASLPILTMTVLYPGLLCAFRAARAVGYGSELISPDQTFSISSQFMVLGRLRF